MTHPSGVVAAYCRCLGFRRLFRTYFRIVEWRANQICPNVRPACVEYQRSNHEDGADTLFDLEKNPIRNEEAQLLGGRC